ncbi:uncharacterized protein [Chelonus insularis]|uniref:uncharacterized protein n=1 Tax=Chelonus insularis TaxID=460826 RepID=UPI00158BEB1A|nr:uncharacterized protein LOC118073508 [Chelonus insularis]
MKKRTVLLILCLVAVSQGEIHVNKNREVDVMETKIIKRIEELNKLHRIKIFGDIITLEKLDDSEIIKDNLKRSDDPLVAKVDDFFNSKKIQVRFPTDGSAADFFGRALGQKNIDINLKGLTHGASEARTKLKKMILPILLALKFKALVEVPVIIALIGALSLKGLGTGLAALFIASAVALKSLVTPPIPYPARVSYGIVKPEIYHEHWHRSQEEINQPYKAWDPDFNIDSYPYHSLP